jgi:hypothetical protein
MRFSVVHAADLHIDSPRVGLSKANTTALEKYKVALHAEPRIGGGDRKIRGNVSGGQPGTSGRHRIQGFECAAQQFGGCWSVSDRAV